MADKLVERGRDLLHRERLQSKEFKVRWINMLQPSSPVFSIPSTGHRDEGQPEGNAQCRCKDDSTT